VSTGDQSLGGRDEADDATDRQGGPASPGESPDHGARGAWTPISLVTQFVGVTAILIGLIYGIGAGIFFLRLTRAGTPTVVNVIGSLPRQLLLSTAFLGVVAPALAAAVVFVAVLLMHEDQGARLWAWTLRPRSRKRVLVGVVLVSVLLTVVAAFPLVRTFLRGHRRPDLIIGETSLVQVVLWLGCALALQLIFLFAGFQALTSLARRRGRIGRSPFLSLATATLLAAIVMLPSLMLYSGGVGFTKAKLCPTSGSPVRVGLLIGESTDRIYLLLPAVHTADRIIVSYPSSRLNELLLGPSSASARCP
jgi:hypothetical protein